MWNVSVWPSTAITWPVTIMAADEARKRHVSDLPGFHETLDRLTLDILSLNEIE
jgi:hypothetical protein